MSTKYRTIVLSDVHLGSKWSKVKEATHFLKTNSCETLILCGDIIDGWAILRGKKGKWKRRHTKFVKALLDLSHDTRIVYVMGNHDDFLDRIVPVKFLSISLVRDFIYESGGKRYFVFHGDKLDRVTSRMNRIAKIADVGYSALLHLNGVYNNRRIRKGLPYRSLSDAIKKKVKAKVSHISDFESRIVEIARQHDCGGVICGHIHRPEICHIDDILYLNSGDWIESLSALTEDFDGNWSIYRAEKMPEEASDDASEETSEKERTQMETGS